MFFSEHAAVRSVVQNPCRSIRAAGPQSLLVHAVIKGVQDKLGECAFLVHFCLI